MSIKSTEEVIMGSGTFNVKNYRKTAADYKGQNKESLFTQRSTFADFDPLKIAYRESCASKEHSDPTSVIIACDVTGSMGKIPYNLLKGGLGRVMESFMKDSSISNPQVMFAAVGDTECDQAPLQVTQFESDNRIQTQLKQLYLEGGGGGNNTESYQGIWYFAAYKTRLDSLVNGKKGLLFTMGDEMMPPVLKANHIRRFIDPDYKGLDITTGTLLQDLTKKYEVFHLVVQDTRTYTTYIGAEKVNSCWRGYLGERAILVPNHIEIPEKIISTVRALCELQVAQIDQAIQAKSEDADPLVMTLQDNMGKGLVKEGLFGQSASKAPGSSEVLKKDSDNIPHLFQCPISQATMREPVVAEDGHNYERESITQWFQNNNTSPMTNEIIGKLLIPNHDLRSEIEQWQEKQESQENQDTSVFKMANN